MGPFEWLASRWMPEIKYGDHLMYEVENVAWDCTMTGIRRGFLIGSLCGVLVMGIGIGTVVMAGLYTAAPLARVPVPRPDDTSVVQASREELNALRQENQALKKQVAKAAVAANCPPSRPPETGKGPSESQVAASVSPSTKQGITKSIAASNPSVAALDGRGAQPSSPPRVATAPGGALRPPAPTPTAKAETSVQPPALGVAIVDVRTSQGRSVPGVPIAFRFLDDGNNQIGGTTVATNAGGRSTAAIPSGTACAEYHLPADMIQTGRVKPGISSVTGLPLAAGLFRTCGAILAHPNGILGVFTID